MQPEPLFYTTINTDFADEPDSFIQREYYEVAQAVMNLNVQVAVYAIAWNERKEDFMFLVQDSNGGFLKARACFFLGAYDRIEV